MLRQLWSFFLGPEGITACLHRLAAHDQQCLCMAVCHCQSCMLCVHRMCTAVLHSFMFVIMLVCMHAMHAFLLSLQ